MLTDIIRDREHLFLGSRLKRLAERMQGDVIKVTDRAGIDIQPGQYPLLGTLEAHGPQTIGALTAALQLSQPSVTRNVARLVDMGLVEVTRRGRDQRHKTVALTAAGDAAMARSKSVVWPRISEAVRQMLENLPADFLEAVAAIEARLAERPLDLRVQDLPPPALTIREFDETTAPHFKRINAQWIRAMHTLEATDLEVLDNPRNRIIDPGGAILFVEAQGLGIVGACALQKTGEDQYELTKMGVQEDARGLKAGEFLLEAVIARALEMGAKRLYLLSNKSSQAAIHLYEKHGFVHDEAIMAEFGARYARCNVAMLYRGARKPS